MRLRTGEGCTTGPGYCESCSASWTIWFSRSNGAWSISGKQGWNVKPLAGPYKWYAVQAFRILKKGPTIICRSFEKQLLACYWAFVETKHLTIGPQITMQPELAFMNCVLSDPIRHKAEYGDTQSSNGSGMCVIRPQKTLKAQVSYMKWLKCPWSSLLVHCFLLPGLHPWLHGEWPTISWQRKGRTWARFADVSTWYRCFYLKVNHFGPKSSLGHPWKTMLKWNSPGGQSFGKCIWLCTFSQKKSWPDMQLLYTDLWAAANGLTGWLRT